MVWVTSNIHWGGENWKGILESDAKGYYAYLPAIFIYQDLNFGFMDEIEQKYPNPNLYVDYRATFPEGRVNKYYLGSALMQSPFFLLAHGASKVMGKDMDGYSKYYALAVSISTLFFLGFGLFFIRKTLLYLQFNEKLISFILLCGLFGTNLFVYSSSDQGYSHIYSFGLVSLWLFQAVKFFDQANRSRFLRIVGLSGLLILIRPINFLLVFSLPFIAGSYSRLAVLFSKEFLNPGFILKSLLILLFFPFLQLLFYYQATGSFWLYSYQQEGFIWSDPHFLEILFSYKKGLFLYTPLYLLCFSGLITFWKRNSFRFWSWLGFFSLITYVFSSWWMWFYGGSFSGRIYVEYLPLFLLLFAYFFRSSVSSRIKKVTVGLAFALIVLCQIQSYQYRYYIIHYSEMNQEKYWDNFLKLP